ncbi:MAG: 3'-5' exonuclease [Sulfuricurvum sp.]
MSQSFRVADYIAVKLESFCRTYLDPSMSFVGLPIKSTAIKTSGYITRTNSALIARMIELNNQKIPYGLVRKANEIFKLPLMLCSLKHKGFITDPSYKHLQADIDDWYEEESLRLKYTSPLSYLGAQHPDDIALQQGIRLIARHGKALVMSAYTEARAHEKANQTLTLATAHSVKGLEFDEVTIASDLNDSISDIISQIQAGRKHDTLLPAEQESLNLYYVSCSRAKISLLSATHL